MSTDKRVAYCQLNNKCAMENPTHLLTVEYIAKLENEVSKLKDKVAMLQSALNLYTLDHSPDGFDYD